MWKVKCAMKTVERCWLDQDVLYNFHSELTGTGCASICMWCCKRYGQRGIPACVYSHWIGLDYAVYHCASHARRVVHCVVAVVTWSDLWTNHRRSAFVIPHFAFRIPHSAVQHFTNASSAGQRAVKWVCVCVLQLWHADIGGDPPCFLVV